MDGVLDSPDAIRDYLFARIAPTHLVARGLLVVLCDDGDRVLTDIHLDLPLGLSDDDRVELLEPLIRLLGGGLSGAILLALTRPGWPSLADGDGQWFRVALDLCVEHGAQLLGVYVVTLHGQREVVLDDAR